MSETIVYVECAGCESNTQPDHYHQYINMFSDVVECWWIDSKFFKKVTEAALYVSETLECGKEEAMQYIHALPKRYN